jgi:O-antigen/teichoic acid export membrane protein
MAISTLAIFLLMSFDVMFLKKYKGDETVAFYAIIVKLMTILLMIMNSVTITVSTKIAEYFYVGNIEALSKTMRDSARLIFFLTLPVVVLICMFPEKILTFFGKDFIIAKQPLLILMIGQGICSAFGAVQVYLNMTGRQHIFQIILIIAVATNFTLNRILIPEYGMNGAAVAYSVSMFLWIFISSIIIYKKDKVNVFLS